MAGAVLRFTPIELGHPAAQATTDASGRFVVEGLGYARYAVEIETGEGETIRGVNVLDLPTGEVVEVELKISDRLRTSTVLDNRPDRFAAVVMVERKPWKRFWTGFAIFWGVVLGSGAAVF
jgi:hypothetical protein